MTNIINCPEGVHYRPKFCQLVRFKNVVLTGRSLPSQFKLSMQFKGLEFCHPAMAAKSIFLLFLHIFMALIISISTCYGGATDKTKDLYIVYMGSLPESDYSPLSHHLSLLQEVLGERYLFIYLMVLPMHLLAPPYNDLVLRIQRSV